jgi:signal transduction histidine kinase
MRSALAAGGVAAVVFEVVSAYWTGWPGPRPAPVYVISPTVVLVAYLAVGFIAWQRYPRERIGLLLTIAGYAWLLPSLTNLHAALPFTLGLVVANVYQASLVHLALAWPYGRLRSRFDRFLVVWIYVWNVANIAAGLLFWNPHTQGCGAACPANLLLIDPSATLYNDVGTIASIVGIANTVLVVALVVTHWIQATGFARSAMTRLVCVAVPIAAYVTIANLPDNAGLSNFAVYGIGPLMLALAPVAYAIGMFRARAARGAVGNALVVLEPGPSPARLREALAKALGDPLLQIAFRQPDGRLYLGTDGEAVKPTELPAGRTATFLDAHGDAVLITDEQLEHEPDLLRVTTAAASMAIEYGRLQAEVEAQLAQVRASRARIVEAGDAERRRLERDLHDGAQQRLVTLTLALGMARDRAEGVDPELESLIGSASSEARAALVELRELARGIHPAVLTETGLRGAVQALVERTPFTTTITDVPDMRFAPGVEATAYFVVSEALANVAKHARATRAEVAIRQSDGHLAVRICDDGTGGARLDGGSGLRGLADRVASVGGVLRVDSPPGAGTRLEADIPCR